MAGKPPPPKKRKSRVTSKCAITSYVDGLGLFIDVFCNHHRQFHPIFSVLLVLLVIALTQNDWTHQLEERKSVSYFLVCNQSTQRARKVG